MGEEVKRKMIAMGFTSSTLQPSVYHHKEKDIMVVVHVDDFLASGEQDQLDRLKKDMMETFDLSGTTIGPESNDEHEVKYLNRILRWTPENMMSYEADPKHVQLLLKEWGLAEAKGAVAPTTKSLVDGIGKGEVLDDLASTRTRRSIARLNYLSQDRPDIAYISKELSKHMANPFTGTLKALHVVIKYLKAYPRMVQEWQAEFNKEDLVLRGYSDSDWASDDITRKSTSGGALTLGPVVIAHWSKSQATVALSSGEAEFNGMIKCLVESVSIWNLMQEIWDMEAKIIAYTDASACRGMLLRSGVGRIKHLTTKQLWAQGAVASYGVVIEKIPRAVNSADAFTHSLSGQALMDHLRRLGFRYIQPQVG